MALSVSPVQSIYTRILSKFPQNISFCFAYGSGVKQQLSKGNPSNNMIDLIYCVDDSYKWHEANMQLNPTHYSGLSKLGHKFIAKFQETTGAKVYFNTLVPFEDVTIKYGVISTKDLVTDLLEWSHLYLSGRLHKPVEIVKKPALAEVQTALQLNLKSAVHTALLILPENFTEYEFFYTISNLSYGGDFRMTFGENKNKVQNIVVPQLHGFHNLYRPIIKTLTDFVDFPSMKLQNAQKSAESVTNDNSEDTDKQCYQDCSPMARLHHLSQLPRWPQKAMTRYWNRGSFKQDTEDVVRAIAYDPDCSKVVEQCINEIVWKSSVSQSLKSIITAGFFKSVKYSSRKIMKMLNI